MVPQRDGDIIRYIGETLSGLTQRFYYVTRLINRKGLFPLHYEEGFACKVQLKQ